ncbi:hypothetical protein AB0L59_40540 [Streptomyces sp. NPDC052109]|uniref:hypothetical protein n=1 Tax=Streptomyces sp. NPDC052109 TaxID=3155527 RepID=UPI00343882B7
MTLRTTPPLHRLLDGTARVLFSLWQAYAPAHGGPGILWPFLVLELSFGVVRLAPWTRMRSANLRETCQDS